MVKGSDVYTTVLTAGSQSTLPGTTPFVAMALIEIAVNIVWINHEYNAHLTPLKVTTCIITI